MKIKLLGIDLAKNVFQLCALNQANKGAIVKSGVWPSKLHPAIDPFLLVPRP